MFSSMLDYRLFSVILENFRTRQSVLSPSNMQKQPMPISKETKVEMQESSSLGHLLE